MFLLIKLFFKYLLPNVFLPLFNELIQQRCINVTFSLKFKISPKQLDLDIDNSIQNLLAFLCRIQKYKNIQDCDFRYNQKCQKRENVKKE